MKRIFVLGLVVALLVCCFAFSASADAYAGIDFTPREPYYDLSSSASYEETVVIEAYSKQLYCVDQSVTDVVNSPAFVDPFTSPIPLYETTSEVGSFNKKMVVATGFYELPAGSTCLENFNVEVNIKFNVDCFYIATLRFTLEDGSRVDYKAYTQGVSPYASFWFVEGTSAELGAVAVQVPVNTASVRLFIDAWSPYAYNVPLQLLDFSSNWHFEWDKILLGFLGITNILIDSFTGITEELIIPDYDAILGDIEYLENGIFGNILGSADLFPTYAEGAIDFFEELAPALLAVVGLLNLIFGIEWLMGVIMVSLSLGLLAALLNITVGVFGSISADQEAVSREKRRVEREEHRKSYEYYRDKRSRNEAYSARYKAEKGDKS